MTSAPHVHHLGDVPWETHPGRTDGARWTLLIDRDRTPSHGVFLSGKD
ncbi:MAG: hypothetical protein VCF08_18095 [Alphaproteobacteria bacterium]